MLSSVDKIVDKKRVILEHDAALECVTDLQRRVLGINGLEYAPSYIFYDADTVWEPTYTDTVSRNQIFYLDGLAV